MTVDRQCKTYGSYETEYGRTYNYPTNRMYVHSSVYLPNSEIDPRTGLLTANRPRQGRTQAKQLEYAYLGSESKQIYSALKKRVEKPGARMSLRSAILLIAATSFVFSILLLSQQGTLAAQQKNLNRMNRDVEDCAKENTGIAEEIQAASDAAVICYAAARDLDMIPSETAQAIHLVAMDTRPLDSPERYYATLPNDAVADSQIPDVDATRNPTIASAGAGY